MIVQNVPVLLGILAVIVLGAYLIHIEARARLIRRQYKRMHFASELPMISGEMHKV